MDGNRSVLYGFLATILILVAPIPSLFDELGDVVRNVAYIIAIILAIPLIIGAFRRYW